MRLPYISESISSTDNAWRSPAIENVVFWMELLRSAGYISLSTVKTM